jgi:hypothetical protein
LDKTLADKTWISSNKKYCLNSGYLFSEIISIEKRIKNNKIHLEIKVG